MINVLVIQFQFFETNKKITTGSCEEWGYKNLFYSENHTLQYVDDQSTIVDTTQENRIQTVKLKIPRKSRILNFCYIQVIVFDLGYLPVAAVGT